MASTYPTAAYPSVIDNLDEGQLEEAACARGLEAQKLLNSPNSTALIQQYFFSSTLSVGAGAPSSAPKICALRSPFLLSMLPSLLACYRHGSETWTLMIRGSDSIGSLRTRRRKLVRRSFNSIDVGHNDDIDEVTLL